MKHRACWHNRRFLLIAMLVAVGMPGCGSGSPTPAPSEMDESITSSTETNRNGQSVSSESFDADKHAAAENTGKSSPDSDTTVKADRADQSVPQPIFRTSDNRPKHDDRRLANVGIRVFELKRLKLYTDINPKLAAKLPPIINLAFVALEKYFGKLPPNRERTDFQITGYLMADKALFRDAGLLPNDLHPFKNGRHRGAELWMNDQQFDYYRRHLLIHESTHCFMEAIAGERFFEELPMWYWEGMAEMFGTHHIGEDGAIRFRVMPGNRDDFDGFGRITLIRSAMKKGGFKSLDAVQELRGKDYLRNDSYAWSWGLCKFLDTHPRYRTSFRSLSRLLTGSQFTKALRKFLTTHRSEISAEWPLFVSGLDFGYDIERAAVVFQPGRSLESNAEQNRVEIRADRGWQSSGLLVERGTNYEIVAKGQFTLAQQPRQWISEPQGISFDYFNGRPLGLLLATIHADGHNMTPAMRVGRRLRFVAPKAGTLYFRLNDSWSRLADNTGKVTVQVHRTDDKNDKE